MTNRDEVDTHLEKRAAHLGGPVVTPGTVMNANASGDSITLCVGSLADTFGYLHAKIRDGGREQRISGVKVNDGASHVVELTVTGSSLRVTLHGTSLGTINSMPQPGTLTYDSRGTVCATAALGIPGGYFPFTETIESLTIIEGSALSGFVALSSYSVKQITFKPPAAGACSVGLSATDVLASTGSTQGTFTASDIAPTATVSGVPASNSLEVPMVRPYQEVPRSLVR